MSDDRLARMANDIANFFRSYPHDEAVAGVQHHLKSFWTPKMRRTLSDAVVGGATGMDPLVMEAVTRETHARNPVEKEAAGPAEVGEIGASDAG